MKNFDDPTENRNTSSNSIHPSPRSNNDKSSLTIFPIDPDEPPPGQEKKERDNMNDSLHMIKTGTTDPDELPPIDTTQDSGDSE